MRPSPGLIASAKEVFSRTTVAAVSGETRGGASKLVRPALKRPHGFAHSPSLPHAQVRHASTTSAPGSWRKSVEAFVECVYGGTFKALRSSVHARPGPYTSSRLAAHPRPVNARFTHSSPRPFPPRTHFGLTPRPAFGHTSARMGLSSARQFSTGGFGVWDNVVLNVPLALRAAADRADEGIDGRKWKRVKREIRRATRGGEKGVGRMSAGFDARMEKREEFERYFGVQEQVAEEKQEEEKEEKPVTLLLALDPDFDLPLPLSLSSSPDFERLLSPSLLDSLASLSRAYSTHTHRLRTIVNRLNAAGLLDPSSGAYGSLAVLRPATDGVDEEHKGRRVWRVEFRDGLVTLSRVKRVVLALDSPQPSERGEVPHWAEKVQRWTGRNAVEAGEGEWWWIVGGREAAVEAEEEDVLASTPPMPRSFLASPTSTSTSTPSYPLSSSGDEDYAIDAAAALTVAQTFVLPSPASLSCSYSSSSLGEAEDAEDEEAVVWDLSTSLTETEPETNDLIDPAASVWASTDDISPIMSGSGSTSAGSYEDELRGFLSEVDGERERRFVEGMVFV
ncbi:hypothetical protein NBRC10513_004836 [Rhodotorula toruloides]|uniref:Uncharacterized protein n=1 Tax=Rhodotorula toruloides TaxID=5286 RepID=A0A0K3CGW0_RHOTO|nr:hypothetical protein AAT19DRAFT_15170 [Rhodotorula toruloides]